NICRGLIIDVLDHVTRLNTRFVGRRSLDSRDHIQKTRYLRKVCSDPSPVRGLVRLVCLYLIGRKKRRIRIKPAGQPSKGSQTSLAHVRLVDIIVLNVLKHRFHDPKLSSGIIYSLLCTGRQNAADKWQPADNCISSDHARNYQDPKFSTK